MNARLQRLSLINFKCFENHNVDFRDTTIMIGENNAGKSTVVEALRLLGLACSKFATTTVYKNRPDWLSEIKPISAKGISISSSSLDIELEHVFYRYGKPPALIIAHFEEKKSIEICINSEYELFAFFYVGQQTVNSRTRTNEVCVPNIYVLPQIVPLIKEEVYVSEGTLKRNRFSKRVSGNFRNILYVYKDSPEYNDFLKILEQTWNGISINNLFRDESTILLHLRDKEYVTEIYYMGHGVQMWLQAMWFITSAGKDAIIVLDEPDVYMHADLQRKLIRLLRGHYFQTIIATHSVEIMSEVLPHEILIINRRRSDSVFTDNYPVLQAAISGMGSIHNINLSRLLNNKKHLYLEGKDKDLLGILYNKLFPDRLQPLDHITSVETGGWGSWALQKENARKLLAQMPDLRITFLYDKDYHTDQEIRGRKEDARGMGIHLHIWNKKEIENYLIIPSAIARFIKSRRNELDIKELSFEIYEMVEETCCSYKETTFDCMIDSESHKKENRGKEYSSLKKELLPAFLAKWASFDGKLCVVSGKEIISELSEKCKTRYDVSFGAKQIASSLTKKEISEEIEDFLNKI